MEGKKGKTFQEAWKEVKALAEEDGSFFKAGYWETVYRTNIQSAYTAGKLEQYKNNMPPAWELLIIEDGRTSDTCKGIVSLIGNGKALPANHNFWKSYGFPPYHFNCRTSFRAVYTYEIGKGTEVENVPMKKIRKYFKPQKGFGGNPLDNGNWWMLTKGQIERGIKYGIIKELNRTENVIADYDELWKGYTRHKGKNGGWYDLCSDLPDDWEENKSAVEALAETGYKVKVIPEIKNVKKNYKVDWSNPDVFINALLYDVKKPKKMTSNAVKSRIASAWKKQRLTRAVLNVPNEMPEDILMTGIRRQANDDNNKITDIILIYKGNIKELKMADFKK
ncbi:MAG: phage head morphogenesis protein [Treponema sp.]|nr:MAG: phage head morphogenesis protein [Treponema sp.]